MAILSGVPGLQVAVQSFGRDLPEYIDENEWIYRKFGHLPENKRLCTYVECQPDAEFRIRIKLGYPYRMDCQSLTFKASVDGHGIARVTCSDEWFNRSGMFMDIMASKLERLSETNISSRALRFSSIKKVDDHDLERVKMDAKLVSGIGEIVVSVFRTIQQQDSQDQRGLYTASNYQLPSEVAEKALKGKAISLGASYGQPEIIQRATKETIDIDGPNSPIAVFVFKYRSREDLKSEMIIPRSPSPEPVRRPFNARDRNALISREDRKARLAAIKKELAEIKAEEEDAPQSKKRAADSDVLESGRAYKTSRNRNGNVVIDLTDD